LNGLIFDYYDPIYSILLLILIAIVIALASQGWIVYKKDRLDRTLYSFLNRFDEIGCELEERDVPFEEGMSKPLLLLAKAFEQSGNYIKSINILLYLIKHTKDDELLIHLGKIYLKAGFIERAEEIFVQMIKRRPRRKDVLYQLELIYETLNSFDEAKDVLSAIEAQGDSVDRVREYLKYLEIKHNGLLKPAEKVRGFKEMLDSGTQLYRLIIKELFKLDTQEAWKYIDENKIYTILDILWYLPYSKLRLDIIIENDLLKSIYFARGDIDIEPSKESGIFAFDMLCASIKGGYERGDVGFLYICTECKSSYPISFERCPGCMAINSIKIEEQVAKKEIKRCNTLL
jgi:tetratricopeptide (TPR) repeat protein